MYAKGLGDFMSIVMFDRPYNKGFITVIKKIKDINKANHPHLNGLKV